MTEKNPRYARTTDILELLILMQARIQGVSLNDIMMHFSVSRRTAERMRDSITDIFCTQVEEIYNPHSREKYWGFTRGFMNEIINFTPEELANLEKLKELQEKQGFKDKEQTLEQTINKIKALSRKNINKIENSIEILLQTEGFAVKQMPKFKIDINMLDTIRQAMKTNRQITAKYIERPVVLSPYGLIYGEKIYLIGVEEDKGNAPFCYLLHKFDDVKLADKTFDKGAFNLDEYSKKSFGVYQGECIDVKLLFSKDVAEDVLNYNFHNTQKVKQNEDGTVTVKFKASGEYEIMWHLFKWGSDVKVVSPVSLKKQYIELLENTLNTQKKK
ncbi:WYL domain-containing protein [bacterium]|nr:WYL domain-containing protein [bacterium]